MSAILAENLKNLLIKQHPQYTRGLNLSKEVYKRTTLIRYPDTDFYGIRKRTSPLETFQDFTRKILPDMERKIELNLLKNRFEQIKDQGARDSILQAYHKRSLIRFALAKDIQDYQYYPPDVAGAEIFEPKDIFIKVAINEHEAEDIGCYMKFPPEELDKYFLHDSFGNYKEFEFACSKNFGVMCTEEGLTIVNSLRAINDFHTLDINKFLDCKTKEDIEWLLKDEEIYPKVYHLFSIDFIDALRPYRKDLFFQKLFHTSPLFDAIINVFVQELKNLPLIPHMFNPETRKNIFNQMAKYIELNADRSHPNPLDPSHLMKVLGTMEINLPDSQKYLLSFPKYKKNYKKLPTNISKFGFEGFQGINSGVFLHGARGSGKSGVLLYLAMWAHKMNWIVVSVPNVFKWTLLGEQELRRHERSGLFLQPEYAVEFLEQFKSANLELIRHIPVNKEIYGKYDGAGVHENDPEPAPNLYDPERKVYFKDYEQFYHPDEKHLLEQADKEIDPPMGVHLKEPKSLLQIVNFGIDNPLYSTNAIYELLEQLYNLESHKVLVCVDQYNLLFRPSCYPSFRYENDKYLKGRVPPYHMALCRAFMHFDGHKIKNGYKVVASGIPECLYRHKFKPDDIFFPKGYQKEMKGLLLNDYKKMLEYYSQVRLWKPSDYREYDFLWMETQGNWLQTLNIFLKYTNQ